jgi:hypothetical protein
MIRAFVAALAGGTFAAALVLAVFRPASRLGPRVAPYAQRARLLMGQSVDATVLADDPGTGPDLRGQILAPLWQAGARRLSDLLDAGGDQDITRRLWQAGWRDLTPEQYRLRQLGSTAKGFGIAVAVTLLMAPNGSSVLVAAVAGLVWGSMRWRARLDRMTEQRKDQMRAELYTVAQLLAIQLRAGTSPIVAIRELATRGGGAVSDDLADALDAIDHGATTRAALERLAIDTPEPAAGRLYRTLAAAETGAGDTLTDALLAMADDLRSQRREEVERLATRRRFQMILPTVAVMGPVLLVLIGAPIPTFIFGD